MLQKYRIPVLFMAIVSILAASACLRKEETQVPTPPPDRQDLSLEARAAVLRAEDRGLVDDPLRAACASSDMQIRETAARALGRIGTDEALLLATGLLADRSPAVRSEAVLALGLSREEAVLDQLLPLAGDDSARVRARVALALTLVPGEKRRQAVLTLIDDPDPLVSEQACLAAAALQPSEEVVVTKLAPKLDDDHQPVRHAAAYALARIARRTESSPANTMARIALQNRARDKDPAIRLEVARGLRMPRNGSEIGILKRLHEDVERVVRIEALISLAYPGGPPIQLLDGASGNDFHMVQAALEGMANNGDPSVIQALSDIAVTEGPVPIRIAAIRSLRKAAPALATQLLPIRLWKSDDPRLRQEAARTAGIYPLKSNEPIIEELLQDNIPSVRAAAILAAGHSPGSLSAVMGDLLKENHPDVRYALARAAANRIEAQRSGQRPDPDHRSEAFAILDDLWNRGEGDTQAFPRLAVMDALGKAAPDPAGKAILLKAAGHPDYRFRARAMQLLEEQYGEPASDGPGPAANRPLQDYIEMLRWAETDREAVVTVKRQGFASSSFTIRLDTRRAVRTCWNFAQLAESGFYNGLEFHRLVPNFIIQGGDPWHSGLGDPGFTLLPELSDGPFYAGAVGMKQGVDTGAGSQFFITLTPQRRLDAGNVRFGTVTENLQGVVMLLIPEDRILSIEIREAGQ